MTWSELEPKPEAEEARRRAQERADALKRDIRAALAEHPLLLEHLHRVAFAPSYRPGADPTSVAYSEGTRALALFLLQQADQVP